MNGRRRLPGFLVAIVALQVGCAPLCDPADQTCVELKVQGSGGFSALDVYLTYELPSEPLRSRQKGVGIDIHSLPLARRLRLPGNQTNELRSAAVVAIEPSTGLQVGGALAVSALPGTPLALDIPISFSFLRRDVNVGGPQYRVRVADFTQDGVPDLLTLHDYPMSQLGLTPLQADGNPGAATSRYVVFPVPRALAVGQLNHDGLPDVAVGSLLFRYSPGTGNQTEFTRMVNWGFGMPDGTLGSLVTRSVTQEPMSATPSDRGWMHLLLVDVDNDQQLDFVGLTEAPAAGSCPNGVLNLSNLIVAKLPRLDGSAVLPVPPVNPLTNMPEYASQKYVLCQPYPRDLLAVDLNGDNKPELIVVHAGTASSFVDILVNGSNSMTGSILFTPLVPGGYRVGNEPISASAGDFDGDGDLDFAVVGSEDSSLSILFNRSERGTLAFEVRESQRLGLLSYGPAYIVAADFDLDGIIDLATADVSEPTVSILRGHGDGSFAPPIPFAAGPTPVHLVVTDLDADGRPDLVVANGAGSYATVLLNRPVSAD